MKRDKNYFESVSCSVLSSCLQLYGLGASRLLYPWNPPGRNTRVGCHSLLQGIFPPTQGSNPCLLCSLPGSSIHGILQARIQEWLAISCSRVSSRPRLSNPRLLCFLHQQADSLPLCHLKVQVTSLSRVQLFATPWTAAHQASPSMGFSRQENWSGLPFPSPGESSRPRDRTQVSRIGGRRFNL